MNKTKNILIGVLKYAIAIGLLCFALSRVDRSEVLHSIKSLSPVSVLFAFLFVNLAQAVSSLRMGFYFHTYGLELKKLYSLMLYYVGMFYNNVLPGGIGGDGYKVIVVNRAKHFPAKKAIKLLISERANGLAALLMLLLLLCLTPSDLDSLIEGKNKLFGIYVVLLIPCYLLCKKIIFKENYKVGLTGLIYSIPVQLLFAFAAISIFSGLGVMLDTNEYLILYLIASVLAAVLPVTVGGIGIRELTFIAGSRLLGIDSEIGVTFAIIFYLVYFASSLIGLIFLHKVRATHTHFASKGH